ncbi:MAG: hypothetical protein K2J90_06830 [Lachnospiraceae bacterium]|nr:hypothetical protein [Lachnospiraceae bacterium]
MRVTNTDIINDFETLEQLEHRKQLQDSKKRKAEKKNDERRIFIVGKILLDVFPEFLNLHPQKSAEENEVEFIPLKDFLSALAADKSLVRCLKAKAGMSSLENSISGDGK